MSTTGEIHFTDGRIHRCVFGASDWRGTLDPPWERGKDGLFRPVPGIDHQRIVVNDRTGEVISDEEWQRRREAGTLDAAS
jgi:hypothetical protein